MEQTIVLNFGDIVSEMESNGIKLWLVETKNWFVEDKDHNLYHIERPQYLDKMIRDKATVQFSRLQYKLIDGQHKEVLTAKDVKAFIEVHSKYWV